MTSHPKYNEDLTHPTSGFEKVHIRYSIGLISDRILSDKPPLTPAKCKPVSKFQFMHNHEGIGLLGISTYFFQLRKNS